MITGFLLNIAIFVVVAVVLLFLAISAVITFLWATITSLSLTKIKTARRRKLNKRIKITAAIIAAIREQKISQYQLSKLSGH